MAAHNSSKFDQLLINKVIASSSFQDKKIIQMDTITIIPKSFEYYISESWRWYCNICESHQENYRGNKCTHYLKVTTLDTNLFLQGSLDALGQELVNSLQNDAIEMRKHFYPIWDYIEERWKNEGELYQKEIFQSLTKKQKFCYSYLTSESVLLEKELPSLEKWNEGFNFDTLCSEEDYAFALKQFEKFKVENIGEYLDVYLHIDILLLQIIFENWRTFGRENFGLDMAHCYSLPSFSFNVWLYQSQSQIELLQFYEHICLWEKAKRGGYSGTLGLRLATANNRHLLEFFIDSEFLRTLLEMDLVSLYTTCLSWGQPIRNFKELSALICAKIKEYFQSTGGIDFKTDSAYGVLLVVDLKIKSEFADLLSIFPPLVYNGEVPEESLSPYMRELKKKYNIKSRGTRLLADYTIKHKYVLTGLALKTYMRCGVELLKVHGMKIKGYMDGCMGVWMGDG